MLELTALPSIKKENWIPEVEETDALLVWGGSPLYLCYWMRQSGLADLLPSLRPETVYVGTSGGAMVATPDFGGATYDDSEPLTGSDKALGLVDFSVFPHLEREDMPDTSLANIERWAAGISVPAYAIDDQTAIKVVDGTVEVVSEGHWKLFTPARTKANRASEIDCASVIPPGYAKSTSPGAERSRHSISVTSSARAPSSGMRSHSERASSTGCERLTPS